MARISRIGMCTLAALLLPAVPAPTAAEELWAVHGGATTIELNARALARLGLQTEFIPAESGATNGGLALTLSINPRLTMTFARDVDGRTSFFGGELGHRGRLVLRSPRATLTLTNSALRQALGASFEAE